MRQTVKMDGKGLIYQESGMSSPYDPDWQTYDFVSRKWVAMRWFHMFSFPVVKGKTFVDAIISVADHLPPEVVLYYYTGNESFCAVRKWTDLVKLKQDQIDSYKLDEYRPLISHKPDEYRSIISRWLA